MTLQKWIEYGWLRSHKSSWKEISDLFQIIDRDLQDAAAIKETLRSMITSVALLKKM